MFAFNKVPLSRVIPVNQEDFKYRDKDFIRLNNNLISTHVDNKKGKFKRNQLVKVSHGKNVAYCFAMGYPPDIYKHDGFNKETCAISYEQLGQLGIRPSSSNQDFALTVRKASAIDWISFLMFKQTDTVKRVENQLVFFAIALSIFSFL